MSRVFNKLYFTLLRNKYHPRIWRQDIKAILKKSGKRDDQLSKSYRIITLLNCLDKIAEKILTTRLSYLRFDILNNDQMRGRKKRFAIDAIMALIHDVQLANNNKNVMSCLLLNVKGAFDHVSINQLIRIMIKMRLSKQIIE